jgi:hypothetical protein
MSREPDALAGRESILRAGFVLLGLSQVGVGLWALLFPLSFQDDFPGMGRHWLVPLGPYNEHLITDVGATFLALTVLMFLAALWLTRPLVLAALIAWLVYSVPHLYFHLNNLGVYDLSDQVINGVALGLQVLIPLGLLAMVLRPAPSATTPVAGGAS